MLVFSLTDFDYTTVYIAENAEKHDNLLPASIKRRYNHVCSILTYLDTSFMTFAIIMLNILAVDICIFDDIKSKRINVSFIVLFLYLLIRAILSINADKIKNRYKNYVYSKYGLDLKIEFKSDSIDKFSSILTHIDSKVESIYDLCDNNLKQSSVFELACSCIKAVIVDNEYQDAVMYANRILTDMTFVRELNKRLHRNESIDSDLQAVLDKLESQLVIIDSKLTELERTLNRLLNEQVLVNGDVNEMTFEQKVKFYKSDL